MSNDVLLAMQGFFNAIWLFLTGWYLPGTNITPASFMLFCAMFKVTLPFVLDLISISFSSFRSDGGKKS